jgi:hypothetical protein
MGFKVLDMYWLVRHSINNLMSHDLQNNFVLRHVDVPSTQMFLAHK